MIVEVKRKIEQPFIEKGRKLHVLGVHWDESHKFDYLVELDGKTVSIDQSDTEIV